MATPEKNLQQLLDMIDSYFDCRLSDAEEERLRHLLAETQLRHNAIDEACALMGLRRHTASSRTTTGTGHRKWLPVASVAAAVALVAGLAFPLLRQSTMTDSGTCVAYVNTERITGEEAVMELMMADMAEFSETARLTSDEAAAELREAFGAIDRYETSPFDTETL